MYKLLNGRQIYEVAEVDLITEGIETKADEALNKAEEVNDLAQEARDIAEAAKQELTEGLATVNEKLDEATTAATAAENSVLALKGTVATSLANSSKALEKAERALKQSSQGNAAGGVLGNNWQVMNPVYDSTEPHYLCDCTTNTEGFNLLSYIVAVPSDIPDITETRIDIYKADQEYKHITKCTLPSVPSNITDVVAIYSRPSIAKLNDTYVMSLLNTVVYTTTGDTWQVCNGLPMNQDVVYITRSAACDDTYVYIMQVDAATGRPLAVYKSSDGISFVLHKQLEVILPEGYEGTTEFYTTLSVSNTNDTIFYAMCIVGSLVGSLNEDSYSLAILYTLNNDRTTPILCKMLTDNIDDSATTLANDVPQVTFTQGIYIYNTGWSVYSFNTEFADLIEVIPPNDNSGNNVQGPFIIDGVPILFNFYTSSKFKTIRYINAQWSLAGGYTFEDTELRFQGICNVVDGKITTFAYSDTASVIYLFETTDGMQFNVHRITPSHDDYIYYIHTTSDTISRVGSFYASPNYNGFYIATSLIELAKSPTEIVFCDAHDVIHGEVYRPDIVPYDKLKGSAMTISDTIAIYKGVQDVYISRG